MKLFKFEQNNCTPCKMAQLFIENELKTEPDETFNLSSGNEKDLEMFDKYDVMQTPTFVLVDENENMISSVTGVGQSKIKSIFEERGLI